jgi:hypothetical protein
MSQGTNSRTPPPEGIVVAFLVIGTIFTVIGLGIGVSSWNKFSSALRTEGTVVAFARGKDWAAHHAYPVVRYRVRGKDYEVRGHVSTSPPAYSLGDVVSVLYRPDRPDDELIDSFSERWLLPLVFSGGGLFFVSLSLVLLRYRERLIKQRSTSGPAPEP